MNLTIGSRASRAVAACAIAAALASPALPALAASQKTTTETVAVASGWTDPDMEQLATSSGRLLLRRIKAAASMIDSGQYQAARNELDAAEDTAGAIKAMMPFVVVVDDIRNAKNKLLAQDTAELHDDLLPIRAHLDEMSMYAPQVATAAKQKLDQAEQQSAGGRIAEAGKSLDEATETITSSTIYLPVDYVYGQVSAARIALSGPVPDTVTAKRAVQNAENSLITVVTTAEETSKS